MGDTLGRGVSQSSFHVWVKSFNFKILGEILIGDTWGHRGIQSSYHHVWAKS